MRKQPFIFFIIALSVFALDQLTKYAIKAHVDPFDVIQVTSFFNIVYVLNTGSAFGLFKSLGNAFFIVVAVVAMVAVTISLIRDSRNRLPFALILGGAAGNLADRITRGYVIDFLDFHIGRHHWPSFNIADSALTAGIMLLFVMMLFERDATS